MDEGVNSSMKWKKKGAEKNKTRKHVTGEKSVKKTIKFQINDCKGNRRSWTSQKGTWDCGKKLYFLRSLLASETGDVILGNLRFNRLEKVFKNIEKSLSRSSRFLCLKLSLYILSYDCSQVKWLLIFYQFKINQPFKRLE